MRKVKYIRTIFKIHKEAKYIEAPKDLLEWQKSEHCGAYSYTYKVSRGKQYYAISACMETK